MLERRLDGELDNAWVVDRGIDGAEAGSLYVRHRQTELGVVKQIEKLSSEINPERFFDREMFDH